MSHYMADCPSTQLKLMQFLVCRHQWIAILIEIWWILLLMKIPLILLHLYLYFTYFGNCEIISNAAECE